MGKVIVTVAAREALLTLDNCDYLGGWLRRVPIDAPAFAGQGTDVLYNFHDRGGLLFTGEGGRILIVPGVFDDAHSENDDGEWVYASRTREKAERAPRKTLLGRFQLYDAISIIVGRPIIPSRRRAEVADMRRVLGRFNVVWKARYVDEVRKLRKAHSRETALFFGAAVRRLRLRFAAELDLWEAQG